VIAKIIGLTFSKQADNKHIIYGQLAENTILNGYIFWGALFTCIYVDGKNEHVGDSKAVKLVPR